MTLIENEKVLRTTKTLEFTEENHNNIIENDGSETETSNINQNLLNEIDTI